MGKGATFERSICTMLSEWWTGGKSQDVFWRTSQSGGRATTRFRKGKNTRGHVGDVSATHPSGQPLTKLVTMELKNGYGAASVAQFIDRPEKLLQQTFEGFIEQAMTAAVRAGTPYWLLIHHRSGRQTMLYMPLELLEHFTDMGCHMGQYGLMIVARIRMKDKSWQKVKFAGMRLDAFLAGVDPQDIKTLLRRVGGSKRAG